MGCRCSMFDDAPASNDHQSKSTTGARSRKNEIEFTDIHSKIDPDAPKSVFCPPPPDWALNEHGMERKVPNSQKNRTDRIISNGDHGRSRNPWLRLIDEAKAAAANPEEAEANREIEISNEQIRDSISNEDDEEKEEIVVVVDHSNHEEALDALSRAKSVQSIPATLSDPGPLAVEEVGHRVPFNHHQPKKVHRHSRQLAVDDPIVHYGQYSTLV